MKQTHLNIDKGRTISDLEALFIVLEKLFDAKLKEKPNAGITIAKGQENERKIKYKEAQELCNYLYDYFVVKGTFSLGICGTCKYFKSQGHSKPCLGHCYKKASCHIWDTCSDHSKEKGGFGI